MLTTTALSQTSGVSPVALPPDTTRHASTARSVTIGDRVTLSPQAQERLAEEESGTQETTAQQANPRDGMADAEALTAADLQLLRQLQQRDRVVRAHEQAHRVAGGRLAGAASYTYQTGPDGGRYAVGGEVPIDTGRAGDPEATVAKMRQVRRAALAPLDPSPADRAIAATAIQRERNAQRELRLQAIEERVRPTPETGETEGAMEDEDGVEADYQR